MTIVRTHNLELVRAVLTNPKIYPHITDDSCPSPEEFRPIDNEAVRYMAVYDGEELLGIFMLVQQNGVCWEVHTCLLPSALGARAREAARETARWMFENTECQRITTNVPKYNRLAFKFAEDAGMELYGVNPDSIQKNGKLHDQYLLGLSKGV